MKKIGKLSFNLNKLIEDEKLVNLRGGYTGCDCQCYDLDDQGNKINKKDVTCCSHKIADCCTTDYMNCV